MYACLCQGVTERKVRHAIACGASTIEQIGEACGAGTRCGGCWPVLDEMLRAAGHEPREVVVAGPAVAPTRSTAA
jgi:bacterioferritin-associated ferredoxin